MLIVQIGEMLMQRSLELAPSSCFAFYALKIDSTFFPSLVCDNGYIKNKAKDLWGLILYHDIKRKYTAILV